MFFKLNTFELNKHLSDYYTDIIVELKLAHPRDDRRCERLKRGREVDDLAPLRRHGQVGDREIGFLESKKICLAFIREMT